MPLTLIKMPITLCFHNVLKNISCTAKLFLSLFSTFFHVALRPVTIKAFRVFQLFQVNFLMLKSKAVLLIYLSFYQFFIFNICNRVLR